MSSGPRIGVDGSLTCLPLLIPFLIRETQPIAAKNKPFIKRRDHRGKAMEYGVSGN